MQIRVRAAAVRSMTLLAILCFILEALVAYRVFALRDLQQAALQFQLNAQQVERALNPAAVFKDRNAPEPLASLAMLDRVIEVAQDKIAVIFDRLSDETDPARHAGASRREIL